VATAGRKVRRRLYRQRRARFQRQRRVAFGCPTVAPLEARQRIAERHDFGFRRIAETGIRAALIGHGKSRAFGGLSHRDRHGQALAVNFAFAVKLILMPFACRQRGVGKRRIGGRQLYLFTIKIVTILDLPGQIEIVLILLKIEGKAWSAGTKFERPGASNKPAMADVLQSSRISVMMR
jgi:hypothetical protein